MPVLPDLIGESPGIRAVKEKIGRLLERQADARRLPPILIQGETGTGKGLLARAVHRAGPRAAGSFVDVNCAAIPETMLEAELFGFERGAFTDARQAKPGLFQVAHGGTLFLDEVGLLPEGLQGKLLQVLEERTVRRLGGTRSEPVDVWILTATNEDLLTATRTRRFREDLYHRLAVLTMGLPPLRERGPDILLLAEHFLARAGADYNLSPRTLAPDARAALLAYRWPGNIRELSNVMERVVLLSEATLVTAELLALPEAPGLEAREEARTDAALPLKDAVGSVERVHLLEALLETRWNISRAAARLGISRNTLRYRIEKHGLRPDAPRPTRQRTESRAPAAPPAAAAVPREIPAPAGVRWERRHITLLHAVLVSPGEETSAFESSRQIEVLAEKVRGFGGKVEELSPMGVVAAFGLEPAEDAPRRAALSAMAIQKAVEHTRRGEVRSFAAKVGIHTGQFMVGAINGGVQIALEDKRQAWRILEALVERAEPDSILVSAGAAQFLERRFDLEPAGALEGAPGEAYRLAGRERAGLAPGGRMAQFVGRRNEIELLRSRLDSAVRGQGQVVGIVGEAGIGKSRLLFEFRQGRSRETARYLESRCLSYGSTIPYLPVLDLVRVGCGIVETDGPETIAEKIGDALRDLGMDSAAASPYVLHILGMKEGTEELDPLGPEVIKARTFEILRQMALRASQRRALAIAVEDLYWIDRASEEYFASFVDVIAGARVLLIFTYRPGYRPPWIGKSYATQIALQPLSAPESLSIVRSVLGTNRVADSLVEVMLAKAAGNPFFLEELARTVRQQGGGGSPTVSVPDTVQEAILARMDLLRPQDKRLLQAAAVVGKNIPFALFEAITDLPGAELRGGLARLQTAELLYEASPVPEVEYAFTHNLTQEVAYESLLEADRHALHVRIVEAIERLFPDRLGEHVERLAYHAYQGRVWGKAAGYLRQAGIRAAARSAHREAVAYFEQALMALKHLPAGRDTVEQAIDLRFDLRTSLLPLGELGLLLDCLREAEALAGTLNDQRRLGQLSTYVSNYLFMMGEPDRALESGQRALAIAKALGDLALEVETNLRLGQVYHALGDHRRAIDVLRQSLAPLSEELRYERFGLPLALSVGARYWLVRSLTELGEFAEGIARGDEALGIAEAVDRPLDLIVACQGVGLLHLRKGDLARAVSALERGLGLCRAWNIPLWLPRLASALGSAYVLSGRVAEAVPLLEQAVEHAASIGTPGGRSLWMALLGEGYLMAGRFDDATRLAAQARELSVAHRERGHEAWTLQLLGQIASRRDPPDEETAEDCYRRALVGGGELGMRPLVAHCHLGLGALYRRRGNRPEADEHLSAAIARFGEIDMPFWAKRAEAELRGSG